MVRRALLLVNPKARSGYYAKQDAIAHLQQLGFELIDEAGETPQQFPDLIAHYRDRIDVVIVGGGDGSLNAAVPGLIHTPLPLGILPVGTANNLARTLGIPSSIAHACEIIATGKAQPIDLGWVNGHYFFNIASLGLSAEINRSVSRTSKQRWGVLAYAGTALSVIWRTRSFEAQIRYNKQSIEVKTFQITVGNGRYYGSGLVVAEDAAINDQRLDLYSIEPRNWFDLLALLLEVLRGKAPIGRGVCSLSAQEIEILTPHPCAIATDGELTTQTPAIFRVIPKAILAIAPLSHL